MKINKIFVLATAMLTIFISCNPTSIKTSKKISNKTSIKTASIVEKDKNPLIIHISTPNHIVWYQLSGTLLNEPGLKPLVHFYYFPLLSVPSNEYILNDVNEDVPFNSWLEEKNINQLFLPLYYTFNSNIKPLEIPHSDSLIYFNFLCKNKNDSAFIKTQPSLTGREDHLTLLGSNDINSMFYRNSSEHLKKLLIQQGKINEELREAGAETGTILSTKECFNLILICALKKRTIDLTDNQVKDYIYFIPINESTVSDFIL